MIGNEMVRFRRWGDIGRKPISLSIAPSKKNDYGI
jgi:hypothetical protein